MDEPYGNQKPKPMTDTHTHTQRERKPSKTLKRAIDHKARQQEKKGKEKIYKDNQKTINKMAISTHLSIITLNVNVYMLPSKEKG